MLAAYGYAYMHVVLPDEFIEGDLGIFDLVANSFINHELEFRWHGKSFAGL